jgi:hypothetical protein
MAFAQLTYRESLRDIEACLSTQTSKFYHLDFRVPVRRPSADRKGEEVVRRRESGFGPD